MAAFKDLSIDRSDCPKTKIFNAVMAPPKCMGVIDFRKHSNTIPDADSELVPFGADIKNLSLEKLEIDLHTPVECKNWDCKFIVKSQAVQIKGEATAQYSDTNENIFPPATVHLNSLPNSTLYYEVSVKVDLDSGKTLSIETKGIKDSNDLNRLVSVVPDSSNFKIDPGSLAVSLSFPDTGAPVSKSLVFQTQYNQYLKLLADPKWIKEEYNKKKVNPLRTRGTPHVSEVELVARVKNATAEWKQANEKFDDMAVFRNMPKDLIDLVDSAGDQVYIAETKFQSTKKGFKDFSAYSTLGNMERMANQLLNHKGYVIDTIAPLVKDEIAPRVETIMQDRLLSANIYWNMLSKIPLNSGPLRLKTEFVIEEFDRMKNILKMNLYNIDNDCVVPRNRKPASSDPAGTPSDYDLGTTIPGSAIGLILKKAFLENKLTDCNILNKEKCTDGDVFTLNKMPEIKCDENGDVIIDLPDNNVKAAELFGIKSLGKAKGKIKVEIENCNGAACVRLYNYNKSAEFINLPLNKFLNATLDEKLGAAGKLSAPIPFFKLKHLKKDNNCNFDFQWDLDYQKR